MFSHSIKGSRCPDRGPSESFPVPDFFLYAPIQADALSGSGARIWADDEFAAHAAYGWIPEIYDQILQGIRSDGLPRIGKNNNFSLRFRQSIVQRGRFSTMSLRDHGSPAGIFPSSKNVVGLVCRTVGDDYHFDVVCRIVQRG